MPTGSDHVPAPPKRLGTGSWPGHSGASSIVGFSTSASLFRATAATARGDVPGVARSPGWAAAPYLGAAAHGRRRHGRMAQSCAVLRCAGVRVSVRGPVVGPVRRGLRGPGPRGLGTRVRGGACGTPGHGAGDRTGGSGCGWGGGTAGAGSGLDRTRLPVSRKPGRLFGRLACLDVKTLSAARRIRSGREGGRAEGEDGQVVGERARVGADVLVEEGDDGLGGDGAQRGQPVGEWVPGALAASAMARFQRAAMPAVLCCRAPDRGRMGTVKTDLLGRGAASRAVPGEAAYNSFHGRRDGVRNARPEVPVHRDQGLRFRPGARGPPASGG